MPPAKPPHDANPESSRVLAVLVGVQLPGVSEADHAADLAELGRLFQTLGFEIAATVTQRRDSLAAAAVLGDGKLKELASLTGGRGIVPSGAPEGKTKARARWGEAEGDADNVDESVDEREGALRPSVVVVDHEISPSQARNLERATGARVL